MTLSDLAAALGVSTQPVREALVMMMHEGFVQSTTSGAYRIMRLTRGDIADLYWMQALIVGELAARACRNINPTQLTELRQHHQALVDAAKRQDVERMDQANWEFHRSLNRAAQAPQLLLMLKRIIRFIPTRFYTQIRAWQPESFRGHESILSALADKDEERTRIAAQRHVERAGELLINYFSEAGYWTMPETDETC